MNYARMLFGMVLSLLPLSGFAEPVRLLNVSEVSEEPATAFVCEFLQGRVMA
jgi:hypothetical protein